MVVIANVAQLSHFVSLCDIAQMISLSWEQTWSMLTMQQRRRQFERTYWDDGVGAAWWKWNRMMMPPGWIDRLAVRSVWCVGWKKS